MGTIIEPRIGAVFVYFRGTHASPTHDRYIITDSEKRSDDEWFLDLVQVVTQATYRRHRYIPSAHGVRIEPLADGEEVLFFQAMLAPHTLKGGEA